MDIIDNPNTKEISLADLTLTHTFHLPGEAIEFGRKNNQERQMELNLDISCIKGKTVRNSIGMNNSLSLNLTTTYI